MVTYQPCFAQPRCRIPELLVNGVAAVLITSRVVSNLPKTLSKRNAMGHSGKPLNRPLISQSLVAFILMLSKMLLAVGVHDDRRY